MQNREKAPGRSRGRLRKSSVLPFKRSKRNGPWALGVAGAKYSAPTIPQAPHDPFLAAGLELRAFWSYVLRPRLRTGGRSLAVGWAGGGNKKKRAENGEI